jgi:hypothetical protein
MHINSESFLYIRTSEGFLSFVLCLLCERLLCKLQQRSIGARAFLADLESVKAVFCGLNITRSAVLA